MKFLFVILYGALSVAAVAYGEPVKPKGGETSGGTGVPLFECNFADLDMNARWDLIAIAGDLHTGPQVHIYDRQNKITGWYDVSLITPPASSGTKIIAQTNDGGSELQLEISTQSTNDQMLGILYAGKVVNAVLSDGSEIHNRNILCSVQQGLEDNPRENSPMPNSLVGVWSMTSRWNHCKGPKEGPALIKLFSDGSWDTIPSDTNEYKDFRWTASSDGKTFVVREPGVWSHYFSLVKDGSAVGHSGDNKGCFEAQHLNPEITFSQILESSALPSAKPALACSPIKGSSCGGGAHCCPPLHCVIKPGYNAGRCH